MKEQLRSTFRAAHSTKAPADFTEKLMDKIAQSKQQQVSLVPKAFLWFFVLVFTVTIIGVVIMNGAQGSTTLPIQQYLNLYYEVLPSLILPLCVSALMLIQQVFHYKKIA